MADPSTQRPATPDPADYIEAHILPRMDPETLAYTTTMLAQMPPRPPTIEIIRGNPAVFRALTSVDASDGFEGVKQYELTSKDGATFPIRVYHPVSLTSDAPAPGVHINFHGGGFVIGDFFTEAQLCLSMREAGVVVVDVNYRHCPETLWGKCFEDAWAAVEWVRANADLLKINRDSLSVGGMSAGAAIAAVVQQRARDEGVPLRLAMLTVPVTTASLFYDFYTDSPYRSFHDFVRTPMLPWASIQMFAGLVLDSVPDADAGVSAADTPAAARAKKVAFLKSAWPATWMAPLECTDFTGLSPVFVRTAELDMLRDEGEAYAAAVAHAGGIATLKRYPGAAHTFMFIDFGTQKRAYDADAIVALRQAHGLAALPPDDVAARVDRVLAAVRAQQQRETEQGRVSYLTDWVAAE